MQQHRFASEIAHTQRTIAASPLRDFAVPHLVVDKVFPDDFVREINRNWPAYAEGFQPETKGNHVLYLYRRDYGRLSESSLAFWQSFNEVLWPAVVAATAEAFAAPASEVFGSLYHKHLSVDMALTLMQADPTYPGHDMHTHFYHAPHWAFTMLLYIDPEDRHSRGTSLHRLLPRDEAAGETDPSQTTYRTQDLDWRTQVAMDTFHWLDPKIPDRTYADQVVGYQANRLFAFMDGPLALHAVPFDNPVDHRPDPARAENGGQHARRRILRSHIKIHHVPFYEKHSRNLPEQLDPSRYMRLMAPNAVLSPEDQRHRDQVVRLFFAERLAAYARGAARIRQPGKWGERVHRSWQRLMGTTPVARFQAQLSDRIP